jgi:23S rRNA (adenine2030-N6)-methyltransferase
VNSPNPLTRAGLIVVNPPHGLIDEARVLLPWLAQRLAREGAGAWACSWLTPPT